MEHPAARAVPRQGMENLSAANNTVDSVHKYLLFEGLHHNSTYLLVIRGER